MNRQEILELTVRGIVGSAVSTVVVNVVKSTTPTGLKFHQKIMVGIGSFVISTIAGEICGDYVMKEVNTVQTSVKTAIEQAKQAKAAMKFEADRLRVIGELEHDLAVAKEEKMDKLIYPLNELVSKAVEDSSISAETLEKEYKKLLKVIYDG